jgi:hypothetical protein
MIQRQINESNARQNTSREERESRSMAVPLVYLAHDEFPGVHWHRDRHQRDWCWRAAAADP